MFCFEDESPGGVLVIYLICLNKNRWLNQALTETFVQWPSFNLLKVIKISLLNMEKAAIRKMTTSAIVSKIPAERPKALRQWKLENIKNGPVLLQSATVVHYIKLS